MTIEANIIIGNHICNSYRKTLSFVYITTQGWLNCCVYNIIFYDQFILSFGDQKTLYLYFSTCRNLMFCTCPVSVRIIFLDSGDLWIGGPK